MVQSLLPQELTEEDANATTTKPITETGSRTESPTDNSTSKAKPEIREDEQNVVIEAESCDGFNFLALIGGAFLGIAVTALALFCYQAYKGKRQSNAYNEPFSFDNFVNA